MANPKHEEILWQGVDSWNSWRKQNPTVVPDLSGIDCAMLNKPLAEVDFRRVNLNHAVLSGADLRWANAHLANLFLGRSQKC